MKLLHSDKSTRRPAAFTLLEVTVLIFTSFAVLTFVIPALARAKCKCIKTNCINNLRQTGTAFRMWADDNNGGYPMNFVGNPNYPQLVPAVSWLGEKLVYADAFTYLRAMSNELSTPKIIACPADISRTAATNFRFMTTTNVSYFVGRVADVSNPKLILAGDRNLIANGMPARRGLVTVTTNSALAWSQDIHPESGNVILADGSAMRLNSAQLRTAFTESGTNVSWWVIP